MSPWPHLSHPMCPSLQWLAPKEHGTNRPMPPGRAHSDLMRAPMNLQERQMSKPCPKGTADTEIGRPSLRYGATSFSKTSLSPAQSSYRRSISTYEIPLRPRSAPATGQCKVPRKATNLTSRPTEYGHAPTSEAATSVEGTLIHSDLQSDAGPGSMHDHVPPDKADASWVAHHQTRPTDQVQYDHHDHD